MKKNIIALSALYCALFSATLFGMEEHITPQQRREMKLRDAENQDIFARLGLNLRRYQPTSTEQSLHSRSQSTSPAQSSSSESSDENKFTTPNKPTTSRSRSNSFNSGK